MRLLPAKKFVFYEEPRKIRNFPWADRGDPYALTEGNAVLHEEPPVDKSRRAVCTFYVAEEAGASAGACCVIWISSMR